MRPEDLVFWLDFLTDDVDVTHGVLCRRHADSMVVPRNWTLDDMRDPDLHLFRPPEPTEPVARRRRTHGRHNGAEQLALTVDDGDGDTPADDGVHAEPPAAEVVSESDDAPDDEAWTPTFDHDDELGGLLSARSPLLARAFRGDDRPRPT